MKTITMDYEDYIKEMKEEAELGETVAARRILKYTQMSTVELKKALISLAFDRGLHAVEPVLMNWILQQRGCESVTAATLEQQSREDFAND